MRKTNLFLAGVFATISVAATAEPTVLIGDELKTTFLAKPIVFVRDRDNQKVSWDVRPDGYLYGQNLSRGTTDRAKWEIKDDHLCVTWFGNSTNDCFGLTKDGDTLALYTGDKAAPKHVGSVEK
ncbi:hypothetical protein P3W85_28160 [Cupriavidus basilensis]|uniref:Uncharacterized protein n=1 Tax=Cupriavidus basilensis TaxID=68895 RepID=A0ABT6AWR2_9BURK|nr:hypothetical protein [Cupriavidus basilensis]MDF3836803.1 hypothetical protein [Cupriavidus basilensis]